MGRFGDPLLARWVVFGFVRLAPTAVVRLGGRDLPWFRGLSEYIADICSRVWLVGSSESSFRFCTCGGSSSFLAVFPPKGEFVREFGRKWVPLRVPSLLERIGGRCEVAFGMGCANVVVLGNCGQNVISKSKRRQYFNHKGVFWFCAIFRYLSRWGSLNDT